MGISAFPPESGAQIAAGSAQKVRNPVAKVCQSRGSHTPRFGRLFHDDFERDPEFRLGIRMRTVESTTVLYALQPNL